MSIVQCVSGSFQSEQPSFTLVLWELTVFEVLDYGSHPTACRGHTVNGLGLIHCMYAQLVEEFYRDDLQELGSFVRWPVGLKHLLGHSTPLELSR